MTKKRPLPKSFAKKKRKPRPISPTGGGHQGGLLSGPNTGTAR